jgi:hypothetical protein
VPGREGMYPGSALQLLVYDAEGKAEVAASTDYAAVYEWRAGDVGPVLARGWRSGNRDTRVEEAVAVAGR